MAQLYTVEFGIPAVTYVVAISENEGVYELTLSKLNDSDEPYTPVEDQPIESGNTWNSNTLTPIVGEYLPTELSSIYVDEGWRIEIQLAIGDGYDLILYDGEDNFTSYTMTSFDPEPPCLTKTCNILTPNGYRNITEIKKGDSVITSDNRIVNVEKVLTTCVKTEKFKPRLIKAHKYGNNLPIIDTYISDYHAYQINNKWLLPLKANLPQQSFDNQDKITYYHLKLPNYYQDNLIVNGLVMEGWDGKLPHEIREYIWNKVGNRYQRLIKS